MGDDAAGDRSVPTGRLRRLGRLVKMAPAAGRALLQGGDGERLGRVVTDTLGKLKGGSMKAGQMLAMVADELPPALRLRLQSLYGDVPAMEPEQVREVLDAEIGGASRFERFDETPFAAASLGQVHAARLADGTEVAVKVQYPGVGRALRDDIDLLRRTQRVVTAGGMLFDASAYFRALRDLTLGELDYRREADARDRLAAAVAPFPDLVVPAVHRELSGDRVLTLDRLDGPMLHEWAGGEHAATERDRVGRMLLQAVAGPMVTADLSNSDAHPGNFVVLGDGRLGLLDFGAVAEIPDATVDGLYALLPVLRDADDGPRLVAALRGAGFVLSLPDAKAEPLAIDLAGALGPTLRGTRDFATESPVAGLVEFKSRHPVEVVAFRPGPGLLPVLRPLVGLAHGLKLLRARLDVYAALTELGELRRAACAQSDFR